MMLQLSLSLVLLLTFTCEGRVRYLPDGEPTAGGLSLVRLRMPGIVPQKNDDYLCTAFNLSDVGQEYITQFRIEGTAERAHHMLLYGCGGVPSTSTVWDCGHHGVCDGASSIMFAWAKNAPATRLPPSVGFRMGGKHSDVNYLVMQIHYAHTLPAGEKDYSGMDIYTTKQQQKYIAGIYLLIGQGFIPPLQQMVHTDACCRVSLSAKLHMFAYRTHAHALGRVITGYRTNHLTGETEEIARGNPQWPQAFYGMSQVFDVEDGDVLMARCSYNSSQKATATYMGSTGGDEMCNLYIMYYTDAERGTAYQWCTESCDRYNFPEGSDVTLPPNPLLEEHAIHGNHANQSETINISDKMSINLENLDYGSIFGGVDQQLDVPDKKSQHEHSVHRKPGPIIPSRKENDFYDNNIDKNQHQPKTAPVSEPVRLRTYPDSYIADPNWPSSIKNQPSAVAFDSKGRLIVFHRSDRAWGADTFELDDRLRNPEQGPIRNATLILMDPNNGRVIKEAGQNMFYVPHGLTVDDKDCLWVTDVGAHQVLKLTPLSETSSTGLQVLLELGRKLQPGSGDGEFCKPTSVAVLPSGDFFVADGYCNRRIIKFSKAGVKLFEWGEKAGMANSMNVPHSMALVPEKDMVCVADRENGRIQCFSTADGRFQLMIKLPEFKDNVYAIAYQNGTMYIVNGHSTSNSGEDTNPLGFVIDMKTPDNIIASFGSKPGALLGTPHWLAIGPEGSSIFVADINPYRVTKLVKEGKTQSAIPAAGRTPAVKEATDSAHLIDIDLSSFSPSLIIISIIAVPLLIIIIIVSIVRLRQRGCCSEGKKTAKLDLGSLLGHRDPSRGGFEKLAMEDSDGDGEVDSDSDADVVEYTKARKGNNFSA